MPFLFLLPLILWGGMCRVLAQPPARPGDHTRWQQFE